MSRTEPALHSLSTPTPPAATNPPSAGEQWQPAQGFLIRNIDWKAYRQIAEALDEHHHYRLSYDGRDLELMVKSLGHGMYGRFLCYLIYVVTDVFGLPLRSAGDMTCDREDLERGIEPDDNASTFRMPLAFWERKKSISPSTHRRTWGWRLI